MQHFSLSKISMALVLSYSAFPALAHIQSANSHTQVHQQAGVEIIQIAKPTASGLSHNQYQAFNVEKQGAVFNNALQAGQSQLAGQLAANPHLQGKGATLILNEVVSRQPSTLAGQQEIFGQRADYVLANPNGISYQGGGFINTAKASLVVGKPDIQQGALRGFDVTGQNRLTTSGELTSAVTQLDLVAPIVNVQGTIRGANQVNVIGGKNRVERAADGKLTIQAEKASGTVLDGKIVGSIHADRIRIHSTDDRATLQVTGAELKAKETVISAANAQFEGKVDSNMQNSSRDYTADKRVRVQESQSTRTQSLQKTVLNSDELVIDVANRLTLSATDVQAKQAIISGGETVLGTQTTTNSTVSTQNKSKGAWYRNDSTSTAVQTVHRTTLAVDDLTLVARKGTLTGEAVKLDSRNALLFSAQGMHFNGKNQGQQKTLESNYRNETAKLKTGRNYVHTNEEQLVAGEMNITENLRIGGQGDVRFSGVKGDVGGHMAVESGNNVIFTSQSSRNQRQIDDQEKYWGGIGGAKSGMANVNELVQHGSDFKVKGLAYFDANQGVQISGSRVLAGEGYVRGHQGKLVIDSVQAQTTAQTASRKGTIFNITKSRDEAFSSVTTAQGSTLQSDANLRLLSDNQIDVIGSKVLASGVLDVAAQKVNILGATNQRETNQSSYTFGFSKKFEKEKGKMNIEGLVNEVIDTWLDGRVVDDPLKLFWDHRTYKRALSVTLGSHRESEKVNETTHSASQLAAGNVALNGRNVTLAGSEILANQGSVLVNAEKINTLAQHDTTVTETKTQDVGLTASFTTTHKGINTALTLGGKGKQQHNQTQTALGSHIHALENIVLTADSIVHQGSRLTTQQGDIVEQAKNIRHEAAKNSALNQTQQVNAGVTLSVNVDKKFNHTYGLEIGGEGSRESELSHSHTLTTLQSGKDILIAGQQVSDVGTQYQVGSNVTIDAAQYDLQSAVDQKRSDKLSAGAKIGVGIETNGGKEVSAKVNIGAHYQQNQASAESIKQANIQAENVLITADRLNMQGNIQATNEVVVHGREQLNFNQSTAHAQQSGGGFKAELAVGGIVKGGAPMPSVDLSLNANGEKGHRDTAVMNTISGKNVVLQSGGNNQLQGTNVQGDTVKLEGERVILNAGESHAQLNAGSAGIGLGIGKGGSSVKVEGNFSAKVEKETNHTGAMLKADQLTVTSSNGVQFNGVQASGQTVSIEAGQGNLTLNALKNQTHKTHVAASLALNGDVKDKEWQAKGGSASLDVNIVRNETHAASAIQADNVNLNVNGNLLLNGSAIVANQVNGAVSGNVISSAATDKINETAVSLSASGSGQYRPYRAPKLLLTLKKDWDNGAIAGIKAEAAASVSVDRKQRGLPTGVISANNQLQVGGSTVTAATAPNYSYHYANQGKLTTNLKQEYYKPWRVKTFGQ